MSHLTYIAPLSLRSDDSFPGDDSFSDVGVCIGVAPNKEVTLLSFRHRSEKSTIFSHPEL